MPFGTITSTSNTFGSISGDVGANVPGTLTGSVGVPGPVGPVGPAGPQGPQGIPGVGGAWGSIVGTLSAQGDLWSALSSKYDASNPNGFITSTALVPYITSATAASTYQPLSGMTAYLTTASAASTYAPIAAGLPTGGTFGQVLVKNSGTAYDATFQTLIPGDRYVTTSNSSLTVSNGIKNLTIGTGLAYTPNQDVTISLTSDPTLHHMHGQVTAYNSGTGAMTVDVQNHTGSGTYSAWTVNVGGIVPLQTVEWGEVLGNLGDQTDLATALGNKLETSDAATTYQTIAGMSSYLTTADAATTYYLNTNPDAFITASALTGYATESWVTSQGYINSGSLAGYATESWVASQGFVSTSGLGSLNSTVQFSGTDGRLVIDGVYDPGATGFSSARLNFGSSTPSQLLNGDFWTNGTNFFYFLGGSTSTIASTSFVTSQGYITSSALSPYLTSASAASTYAALSGATFTGLISTPAATTSSAFLRLPHGTAPTTPVNGDVWTTTGGLFWRQNGSTQQAVEIGSTQTISGNKTFSNANVSLGTSTAAGTINVGTGATISGSTKAINIGTAGVSGSTTNITLGSAVSGALGTTTINGNITATGTTLTLGNSTAASTINVGTGATLSGSTKTINIGTNGVIGSTNVINIGPTATSGNINFNNNSVALGSNSTATTAAADTNSTALATTAYVVGQAGSATPLVNGTAAVGTSLRYARQDHVHPTDTSRAALASPTFTGTPAAPTAAVDTNTTQIATTAYVVGQGYAKLASPALTGTPTAPTATAGTNTTQLATTAFVTAAANLKADLASPALTGTPTAPTATAGTNTTQIATTAFVTAAVPALATLAEARQFTNDTKVMSPRDVLWSMLSQDFVDIDSGFLTTTNVGTITTVNVGQLSRNIRPGTAGACSCRIRTFGSSQVDQTWTSSSRPQPKSFLNFSLRSIHSGRSTIDVITDANFTAAFYYGKAEADGVGDLVRRGYGWKMVGGSGSRFLQLQAHNGTTLSSVTSSFAVTAGVAFDWDIESDGAGNVTLYVNGSSVATSTGGPTGSVNITGVVWQEEMQAAAALASPFTDFTNSRGRYIVINSW